MDALSPFPVVVPRVHNCYRQGFAQFIFLESTVELSGIITAKLSSCIFPGTSVRTSLNFSQRHDIVLIYYFLRQRNSREIYLTLLAIAFMYPNRHTMECTQLKLHLSSNLNKPPLLPDWCHEILDLQILVLAQSHCWIIPKISGYFSFFCLSLPPSPLPLPPSCWLRVCNLSCCIILA